MKLEKEADATRYPVIPSDARSVLQETEGEQYLLGKITFPKAMLILYYSKPAGVAPLGKITAVSYSLSGKKIASEAIGVFADFSGMRFRTTLKALSQDKGAVSISSNVEALKDNGEVNTTMSNQSVYHISAKGKITRM